MKKKAAKKILVTGCCGGMGREICKKLSDEGFIVYGLDYIRTENAPDNFYQCDVTDNSSLLTVFERIAQEAGKLDAIVHTAGIYDLDSLIEIDEKRFTRIFDINLFGVYRINKLFVPLLNKKGRVIITSSELAPLDPLPFTGLYGITKTALEGYAYSLRTELGLLGIKVIVIRPGAVKTDLLGDSTTALDKFCENTQLYNCNAERFRKVVNSVESRNIPPKRIADTVLRALNARAPKRIYNINRNPLLLLLNALPPTMQSFIISVILKP